MRIAVAYKWAPNPQDASVAPDGTLDWTRARPAVSDYDAAAIALGRTLADAVGADLVGLTVGPADAGAPFARKAALARGLDRLVLVADDRLADAGPTETATVLARLVARLGCDLLLTGEASLDSGAQLVPAIVAAALGVPSLAGVTAVAVASDGLVVSRRVPGGAESVRCAGPVVLSVAADAADPGVPGMRDVLAAAKKPTEVVDLDTLVTAPRPAVVGTSRPAAPARLRRMIDATDPDAAASALASALNGGRS